MTNPYPDIIFRPATPTDLAAIPLILSSGPDAFAYVFAQPTAGAEAFLRHAFIQGSGEFGYRNHVVGEIEGEVVAAGAGWTASATLPFMLAAIGQFIAHYGAIPTPGVILRGLRTETIIRPPGQGDFYIGHLGVAPAWRGRGIGEALTTYLLRAGRDAALAHAVLDVAVTNPRAEALYRRLGFQVIAECPSSLRRDLGFVPSGRRMALNYTDLP